MKIVFTMNLNMPMDFDTGALNIPKFGLKHKTYKIKINVVDVTFYKHFLFDCHFNTTNQIENGAIKNIFETQLVRNYEVQTVKYNGKNYKKILILNQNYL